MAHAGQSKIPRFLQNNLPVFYESDSTLQICHLSRICTLFECDLSPASTQVFFLNLTPNFGRFLKETLSRSCSFNFFHAAFIFCLSTFYLFSIKQALPDNENETVPCKLKSLTMDGNHIVLSYHESLLRSSDMQLLQGPCWLNDTILSFYFEYLEIDKFKKHPALLFVPPQVTQCIKITPTNEIGIFLDPLRTDGQNFIFFALNDNEQTECSGGTHWSLLVLSRPEKTVYHFDSSRGANQDQALEFGEKLLNYYGLPSFGCFSEPRALQQSNGYDCGIHVLCNAENLANYALKLKKIEGCPLPDKENVFYKRREILDLVHKLRH